MTASEMQHELEVLKLKLRIKELEAELSRKNAIPAQSIEEEAKERRKWTYPQYQPYSVGNSHFYKASTGMPIVGSL